MKNFNEKTDLIWRVADLLRSDFKRSDYGKVILPMTVLRRLDSVLETSKQKVLDYLPKVENLKESTKDLALNRIAGFNFHNRSQYNFDKLVADHSPNQFFGYWRVTGEQPLQENGKIVTDRNGTPKTDTSLKDYENIPFLKKDSTGNLIPQTIEEYFEAEVKPHLPEAWIDHSKTKIGYEINFTKYFYEFKPLRPLSEIKADILALEEKVYRAEKKVLDD